MMGVGWEYMMVGEMVGGGWRVGVDGGGER